MSHSRFKVFVKGVKGSWKTLLAAKFLNVFFLFLFFVALDLGLLHFQVQGWGEEHRVGTWKSTLSDPSLMEGFDVLIYLAGS